MKKFLAIAMIAASLTSCGGGETKDEAPADTTAVAPEVAPADTATATAPADTAAAAAAPADTTK